MIDAASDIGFALVLSYGLPVLFVLFVLKGAIVGKVFPTSIVLPGYLVAISASFRTIVASILVASVGYVCGQLVIYALARRHGVEAIRSMPRVSLSEERLARASRSFRRYSGAGIFVTNLVPYVGSFILIPAGIASYPIGRVILYAFVSTVVNYVLIVWLVVGSIRFLTAL